MRLAAGLHNLWPTPMGIHRLEGALEINKLLARVLGALRAAHLADRNLPAEPFFASDDDLLRRIDLPEWDLFVRFVVEALRDTAKFANRGTWPAEGLDLKVAIEGMWFQCSNAGAFHDVHTHGNCSWSGVYMVQVDEPAARTRHPVYGAANGVTRFYGPSFSVLGSAHMDVGNAYLLPPHCDVEPEAGRLTVFPSWLPHQALPYQGKVDRIAISFNASLHATRGDRLHGFSAR